VTAGPLPRKDKNVSIRRRGLSLTAQKSEIARVLEQALINLNIYFITAE
jgi:hypothetical protein